MTKATEKKKAAAAVRRTRAASKKEQWATAWGSYQPGPAREAETTVPAAN